MKYGQTLKGKLIRRFLIALVSIFRNRFTTMLSNKTISNKTITFILTLVERILTEIYFCKIFKTKIQTRQRVTYI